MAGQPDLKPAGRLVDLAVVRAARRLGQACSACGERGESVHHVIPKGERGDDVPANLVLVCGDGARGCHGALHGNPYVVKIAAPMQGAVRRDAAWVSSRIGLTILSRRHDVAAYVLSKLGREPGLAYLERRYHLDPADVEAILPA